LAARADPKRVHIVTATRAENGTQSFNLQADLDLLEQSIEAIGDVCLVCVDPISSYLGKVDSHKNAELRAVLEPIGRMAERKRVAILSVTHFSKGNAGAPNKALYRFIGSIAFTAAPADPTHGQATEAVFYMYRNLSVFAGESQPDFPASCHPRTRFRP
jgi:putative DNA primase/helicase